ASRRVAFEGHRNLHSKIRGQEAVTAEELAAVVQGIRDRVRARYPDGGAPVEGVFRPPLADLTPIVHARDAAEAKVAAIGSVNPRSGGLLNSIVQSLKRAVARGLDWHVREQIEFNRQTMSCVEATLQALNESNRAILAVAGQINELKREIEVASELRDIRDHWAEWRINWEHKLFLNETQFLRSVADLQTAFQHRASLMESNFRDISKSQHADFLGALARSTEDVQKRFWHEVEKSRLEYERVIHEELRIVRQRAAIAPVTPAPAAASETMALPFDYGRFAERFRGPEAYVKKNIGFYVPHFAARAPVLDIGCGRGEFLELMRECGLEASGIDLSEESVAQCRSKGLTVERADLFDQLRELPRESLGGIFCGQVVEHLPPARLPDLVRLASEKLRRGGVLVIETPNPECLAIFATHFYLDPTHTRPVPHPLLAFYMEECGFGRIDVHRLSPAIESMPALESLPEAFRNGFFGGLDYAILGVKL
ncbi:MAG: class I SAM-dependent methyltransferase, partial [Bryobacteraceae bacterium]